jgi:hypothetical protein
VRIKRLVGTALGTTLLLVTATPAVAAPPERRERHRCPPGLDQAELRATLDAIHTAGVYGTYSSVRDGRARWTGASGLADVDTGR